MSDAEFRKYERAVKEGEIDAIPKLITAALRTNTPIHTHLPTIYDNLNQDVMRTLEGSELMDLRLYRAHSIGEAAAILERSGRVLPSLELLALNHEITGIAGGEDSNMLMKESIISLDKTYFIRATLLSRLANGQRIPENRKSIDELTPTYDRAAESESHRPHHKRTICISPEVSNSGTAQYTFTNFFSMFKTTPVIANIPDQERPFPPAEQLLVLRTINAENIECGATPLNPHDKTLLYISSFMLPTITPRAEHILGNPNVFEFPQ